MLKSEDDDRDFIFASSNLSTIDREIPEMLDFFGLEKISVKEIRTICGF